MMANRRCACGQQVDHQRAKQCVRCRVTTAKNIERLLARYAAERKYAKWKAVHDRG